MKTKFSLMTIAGAALALYYYRSKDEKKSFIEDHADIANCLEKEKDVDLTQEETSAVVSKFCHFNEMLELVRDDLRLAKNGEAAFSEMHDFERNVAIGYLKTQEINLKHHLKTYLKELTRRVNNPS